MEPEEEYTLEELTKEEGDALTTDLQDVLKKHGAEMGVKASIQLLKRVPVKAEEPEAIPKEEKPQESVVSPIQLNDNGEETETAPAH